MTGEALFIPSRSNSSRRQLVLEFIRHHFRRVGAAPSHTEIGEAVGQPRQRVGRWLDELQEAGLLTYTRYKPRSIVLVDRLAMHSDLEIELAAHARGWTIIKPSPSAPLAEAYPIEPDVPEFGLPLIEALQHIE